MAKTDGKLTSRGDHGDHNGGGSGRALHQHSDHDADHQANHWIGKQGAVGEEATHGPGSNQTEASGEKIERANEEVEQHDQPQCFAGVHSSAVAFAFQGQVCRGEIEFSLRSSQGVRDNMLG